MSDGDNYCEFNDEESECPTEIQEETVLTAIAASKCATHCECECDHGNFKTNQNTGEKKLTVQVSFGIFFYFDTDLSGHPIDKREGYC